MLGINLHWETFGPAVGGVRRGEPLQRELLNKEVGKRDSKSSMPKLVNQP